MIAEYMWFAMMLSLLLTFVLLLFGLPATLCMVSVPLEVLFFYRWLAEENEL